MSKRFLFITPLTPKRILTPLRSLLFEQYINALKKQSYTNWEAILIGEEDNVDGNIKYLSVKAESKEIKLIFAKEYILSLKIKPDYIIRIDDDDVINPFVLERIADLDFDCYVDAHHAFYDLTTGMISLQKREWFANTVIHKYEHAMKEMEEDQIPLIQCDHSKAWVNFYKNKKILFADKRSPIYLRILSPTTVTSGIHGNNKSTLEKYDDFKSNVVKLRSLEDVDFTAYKSYIKGFGTWKYIVLQDFKDSQIAFDNLWTNFSGNVIKHNIFIKIQILWNSLMV